MGGFPSCKGCEARFLHTTANHKHYRPLHLCQGKVHKVSNWFFVLNNLSGNWFEFMSKFFILFSNLPQRKQLLRKPNQRLLLGRNIVQVTRTSNSHHPECLVEDVWDGCELCSNLEYWAKCHCALPRLSQFVGWGGGATSQSMCIWLKSIRK